MTSHARRQQIAYDVAGGAAYDAENAGKTRTFHRKAEIAAAVLSRQCPPGASVLEIGCGTGLFTEPLAARLPGARIVASDVHEGVLNVARERLAGCRNVDVVRHDAAEPWDDGWRFDAVVGVDIVHHLGDPVLAMAAWRAAVTPGGALCVLETNPLNPVLFLRLCRRREERRVFLNSRTRLAAWAAAAGWTGVETASLPFYLWAGGEEAADRLSRCEDWMHRALPWLRPFSGLLLLQGRNR